MSERVLCLRCKGRGREWFPQGGSHGIGSFSTCGKCGGAGQVDRFYESVCGGCDLPFGHPHPVTVDRLELVPESVGEEQ